MLKIIFLKSPWNENDGIVVRDRSHTSTTQTIVMCGQRTKIIKFSLFLLPFEKVCSKKQTEKVACRVTRNRGAFRRNFIFQICGQLRNFSYGRSKRDFYSILLTFANSVKVARRSIVIGMAKVNSNIISSLGPWKQNMRKVKYWFLAIWLTPCPRNSLDILFLPAAFVMVLYFHPLTQRNITPEQLKRTKQKRIFWRSFDRAMRHFRLSN